MSKIKIINPNNSWIITNDKDTDKIGSIVKTDSNVYQVRYNGFYKFYSRKQILQNFGEQLFSKTKNLLPLIKPKNVLYDYPTDQTPYNGMFDVKKKVPIYTKEKKSKSFYGAGYYIIKKYGSWQQPFCPKLITLEKYKFHGPFVSMQKLKAFEKKYIK